MVHRSYWKVIVLQLVQAVGQESGADKSIKRIISALVGQRSRRTNELHSKIDVACQNRSTWSHMGLVIPHHRLSL